MLAFSPICQIFAVIVHLEPCQWCGRFHALTFDPPSSSKTYIAVIYGYLYLMFTSFTPVFEEYYGFTASNVGLVFLGVGVGSIVGLLYYSLTSDRYSRKMAAADGQGMKPEYRLKPLPWAAILLPAGFFLYGWTAQIRVHWVVPLIGHALIGFSNLILFMCMQLSVLPLSSISDGLIDCLGGHAKILLFVGISLIHFQCTQRAPWPPIPSFDPLPAPSSLWWGLGCTTSSAWAGVILFWGSLL